MISFFLADIEDSIRMDPPLAKWFDDPFLPVPPLTSTKGREGETERKGADIHGFRGDRS
jgi:hypothetical protein